MIITLEHLLHSKMCLYIRSSYRVTALERNVNYNHLIATRLQGLSTDYLYSFWETLTVLIVYARFEYLFHTGLGLLRDDHSDGFKTTIFLI